MNAFEIDLPARGGAVHALRFGPADRTPDLVFLHANGFNARTYRALLEPLADDWCALAFDQRGHGLSRLPADGEGRWSWFDLRDDLLAVLDALRIERAVLAGHSMGGTVSVLASAAEPARARSLLLLDPVIIPSPAHSVASESPLAEMTRRRRAHFDTREQAMASYRGRGAFAGWPDEMLADYLADGLVPSAQGGFELACAPAWEASGYVAHGHDSLGHLARITCPTRILKAETASTCTLQPMPEPPGGLLVETIPGTGHFLPMQRADIAREALREALRG